MVEEAAIREQQQITTVETVKQTYTDLLTKNPKEQAEARQLIDRKDGAREFVMAIAIDHLTGRESANLMVAKKWIDKIIDEAIKNDIPPQVALALALVENGGRETQVSERGAVGIFQLMEKAAIDMGLKIIRDQEGIIIYDERKNPQKNIEAGIRYLALQRDRFGGDLGLALRAYNRGPQTVLNQINTYSSNTLGYTLVGPEGSFDDPMTREIIKNYISNNHVSAYSLTQEDEYVARVAAAAEYLVAEKIVEPEKQILVIPIQTSSYPSKRTDGAVV